MDIEQLRQGILAALETGLGKHSEICEGCMEAIRHILMGSEPEEDKGRRRNLAQRNNNPGNLMFVGQRGAERGEKGFARWPSPEEGWSGLMKQVALDQNRGLTMRDFVTKYAPPSENDTVSYLRNMCRWLNCKPDSPLSALEPDVVAVCLAKQEGYFHLGG